MRRFAHLRLALLGTAMAVPATARAGDDVPAPEPTVVVVQPESPAPQGEAKLPHYTKHLGGKPGRFCSICKAEAKARAKAQAQAPPHVHVHVAPPAAPAMVMPDGSRIVGCAHSSNGVCPSCRALLAMPGQVTMVAPGAPGSAGASAPGRSVATDSAPGQAVVNGAEPEPIGVMRTNFRPGAPGAPPTPAQAAAMPASSGRAPFLSDNTEPRPRVLSHLFGFSVWERDMRDAFGRREKMMRENHAATPYGPEAANKVEDLPASAVYGKGPR